MNKISNNCVRKLAGDCMKNILSFLKPTDYLRIHITCRKIWDLDVSKWYWTYWTEIVEREDAKDKDAKDRDKSIENGKDGNNKDDDFNSDLDDDNKDKKIKKAKSKRNIKKYILKRLMTKLCRCCQILNGKLSPLGIKLCRHCQYLPHYKLVTRTEAIKTYCLPIIQHHKIHWVERKSGYGKVYLAKERDIINLCSKFYPSMETYNKIINDPKFRKEYKKVRGVKRQTRKEN